MIRLSQNITTFASGRKTLLALFFLVAFAVIVLPGQAARSAIFTVGLGIPDLKFTYTGAELLTMAKQYGLAGRQTYLLSIFTFDLAFPIIYGFFGVLASSWVSKKISLPLPFWDRSNLLWLAGLFFDGLENITVAIVMTSFPSVIQPLASLAGLLTLFKWVFLAAGAFAILLGLVALSLSYLGGIKRS